ncbi:alanine racemase [Magnetospirillum sp. UT-4]|uniref:alanine racemase n=1 Tax=Magnetospirillum sp. UT-4 TaxID=2681467 RepID=UPI0013843FFA|nr:alanine racemase [Magnetospirillum sp. UT-4]CAA7623158.1 Alanine racemase [Magnetospirillum sp. UT-4]
MTNHDRAPAILAIDLDAVVANWRLIKARAPGAEAAAVVKADGYGLGAARVAKALARAGCRSFFVATIDEGIALRKVLPEQALYVLCGPLPGAGMDLVAHRLVPVLNSLEQIGLWLGLGRATGEALPAILHIDTGMNRLGLDAAAVAHLAAEPALLEGLSVPLVMSHMACADEPGHAMNRAQLDAFNALAGRLGLAAPRSLAASSTVFLGADYHFDMVRPGAALYGVNPVPGQPNPMAPVARLEAKILQVRDVDTPQTVGYGATHHVAAKGRIATVAAGYADGLFRSLGNRGFGVIEGVRVPVVGRISMDLTTFDVSGLAPDVARPGAVIELLGPDHTVDDLALEAGTIGYEVLTALGARYHRVYAGGAR